MNATEVKQGRVLLVGAGPGSVDLITLRGLRALRQAEVIFYDALVNPELLAEAPRESRRIFVGKRGGLPSIGQREINRRLVEEARAGNVVVRLKGGDPLLFGRGGEEALACEEAGVSFEIVPGVTSALGAASHSGIPLTHRGIASSVAFVTARDGTGSGEQIRRLGSLAASVDTLAVFMGGSCLRSIVNSLTGAGLAGTTSVAVVSNATLETQRTVLGTLDSIAGQVAAAELAAPLLILVGAVTNLGSSLNWYERKLSRTADQSPSSPPQVAEFGYATDAKADEAVPVKRSIR
jgi:uroporphyrin-III C-methyltransferase